MEPTPEQREVTDRLVRDARPICFRMYPHLVNRVERDELQTCAWLGCQMALANWREGMPAGFETFCFRSIGLQLLRAADRRQRTRRQPGLGRRLTEQGLHNLPARPEPDPGSRELVERLIALSRGKVRIWLRLMLAGWRQVDIARYEGVHRNVVNNRIRRVRHLAPCGI